jgi:hypothetical protein
MIKDADRIFETKLDELTRLISEFREKIENGTADPDNFMKFHEMERIWSELRTSSDKLYSDMLCQMLSNLDETELIRKKNRIPRKRNPTENY